jgi:hypothetical protein
MFLKFCNKDSMGANNTFFNIKKLNTVSKTILRFPNFSGFTKKCQQIFFLLLDFFENLKIEGS